MRRPIRHLTGAAAALAMAVAASLALAPGTLEPGQLPVDQPRGSQPPAGATLHPATARPSGAPDASDLPDSVSPASPGEQGGGSARPIELLPVAESDAIALQAAVNRARATFGLTTLAVGLSADEQLGWIGGSGLAPDGRTPVTGASPFALASVTKTFTAAIVLQLAEEGRLHLSDLVTDHLPGLSLANGVTVEQLLNHTSGIPDLLAPMRSRLNAQPSRTWTPAEVLALVGASRFAPGSEWVYSNTNYVIAGMLVEAVTGNRFADELERRVLGPLALAGTGFPPGSDYGYLIGESWTSAFWTSAALVSNASDLVRWGDALYGGRILRAATLRRVLDFGPDGYGLGAEHYTVGGLEGYGHSGLLRGYTALLIHLPDAHLTLSVLATGHLFAPTDLLTSASAGAPSILSIALGISPD